MPDMGLCVKGVSLLPAPRAAPKTTAGAPAPRVAEAEDPKDPPKKKPLPVPAANYGPWQRVCKAGTVHSMFLREDPEVITTEVHVPSFWDEEYDEFHQVRWQKRELRCTPAIGDYAGEELLFVYAQDPEHVIFRGHASPCDRCGPGEEGRKALIRWCLHRVLSSGGLLSKTALSRSALVPRAANIAAALGWPLDDVGFAKAAWKVETMVCGPLLIEILSAGGQQKLQFRLPEDATFDELYHSTEVAFYQHRCPLGGFFLSTLDGAALLPRTQHKLNHASLRSTAEDEDEEEDPAAAAGLFCPSQVKIRVHDISGSLVAELEMPGDCRASECKKQLREVTWRYEPAECMTLVLGDGTVWKGLLPVNWSQEPQPEEFRITLVWSSAFQFVVVPLRSRVRVIAGRGVFSEDQVPDKEEGAGRVGFRISATNPSACPGANTLLKSHRGRSESKTPAAPGLLSDLLPEGIREDDAGVVEDGAIHLFEMGPEVVQLQINVTSDANQVGGSFYETLVPLRVSSCVLRSFLSYQFLPRVKWTRLTVFLDKFREVAFKDLKTYMEETRIQGFTLTHGD